MSQSGIPEELLIPIAKARQVSDKELEALKLALKKSGGDSIANQLGISKAAARKRLGEVYKKFDIQGSGPGKLAFLENKLREQISQTSPSAATRRAADSDNDLSNGGLSNSAQLNSAQLNGAQLNSAQLNNAQLNNGSESVPNPAPANANASPASDGWLDDLPLTSPQINTQYHWDGAPALNSFRGRAQELKALKRWILCPAKSQKLMAICGIGGIGKTYLAVQLAEELNNNFEQIVWFKVKQAKAPEDLLKQLLSILQSNSLPPDDAFTDVLAEASSTSLVLSKDQSAEPIKALIQRFIDYISKRRCLVVLDGFETVFKSYENSQKTTTDSLHSAADAPPRAPTFIASRKQQSSLYKDNFDGYRQLLKALRQPSDHKRPTAGASCVILTSQEKPKELLSLLEDDPLAELYTLGGLSFSEARELLARFRLKGSLEDYEQLISRYDGHPMALRLAANTIKDIFFGEIKDFLEQEISVFDNLRSVLKAQFKRLPPIEKEVMYWLAINHRPCSLEDLKADIVARDHKRNLVYTLQSLERRSLVEIKHADSVLFYLHPIVAQYVLDRFIRDVFQDLVRGNLDTFNSHALMKADAEDYLREFQINHIVRPILDRLKNFFKSLYGVDNHLNTKLEEFRQGHPQRLGYAGGNFINLMVQLSPEELSGKDFSQLTIWQAYLQGTKLREVRFNRCVLDRSVFTETLSDVMAIALNAPPPNTSHLLHQQPPLLAAGDTNGTLHLWQTSENKLPRGQKCAEWLAHSSWVRAIAFIPHQPLLVTAGDDSRLKLWRLPALDQLSAQPQQFLAQPEQIWQQSAKDWIHTVSASPDGKLIASGGDNKITLYRIQDGEPMGQYPRRVSVRPERGLAHTFDATHFQSGHSRIRALTFSPDGQRLASCGDDYTIRLWSVAALIDSAIDPEPVELAGHTDWVRTVCFSPDGRRLVSGSEDKTIIVWDADSGCQLKTLDCSGDRVRSVAISASGQFLASGGDDAQVMLWDLHTFKHVENISTRQSRIWSVAFQQQGEKLLLAAGGDKQMLLLWQIGPDVEPSIKPEMRPGETPAIAALPAAETAAWPSVSPGVKTLRTYRGYTNGIRAVAFIGDDRVVGGGDSGELSIWDITGDRKATIPLHQGRIWSLATDPQNALIASAGDDHTIRLWDAETGQCLTALTGHTSWVRAIAFSHGGRFLVSSGDDCTIRIWNTASGFCLKTLQQQNHWIRAVGFKPDSARYLVSGGDDQRVRRWDRKKGTWEALTQHEHRVCSVAYSPDGKTIASGSDDTNVLLWDTDKGEVSHRFAHSELGIKAVAFSPDGKYLAAGGEDQLVYVWDLKAPGSKNCFILSPKDSTGLTGGIRSIAFSPDSRLVISGGLDEMIRIGDLSQIEDPKKRILKPLNRRDRPYENVEIKNTKGLSGLQIANLLTLGAISRTHSLLNAP